jgi:hypothetical protein
MAAMPVAIMIAGLDDDASFFRFRRRRERQGQAESGDGRNCKTNSAHNFSPLVRW